MIIRHRATHRHAFQAFVLVSEPNVKDIVLSPHTSEALLYTQGIKQALLVHFAVRPHAQDKPGDAPQTNPRLGSALAQRSFIATSPPLPDTTTYLARTNNYNPLFLD